MTNKSVIDPRLLRLADALVEEMLASDDGDDLVLDDADDAVVAAAVADLDGAKRRLGRAQFEAAKLAVAAPIRSHAAVSLPPNEARRRLARAVQGSPASGKFTLAARDGSGVPDDDLPGLIEDAADLGIELEDKEDGS